jgi:hypothetical protein
VALRPEGAPFEVAIDLAMIRRPSLTDSSRTSRQPEMRQRERRCRRLDVGGAPERHICPILANPSATSLAACEGVRLEQRHANDDVPLHTF